MITHIFFELPGVLADPVRLREGYPPHLGAVMAARYGGTPELWADAYLHMREDWDSYWADLNLKGDEPLSDLWEGMFRTTRALFRLAKIPEPEKDELIAFSRVLPKLVYERFDALYPQVQPLLEKLHTDGVCLHVATYWTAAMARGLLTGGGVLTYFSEPVLGMDVTESFAKDYDVLALKVGAAPEACLIADSDPLSLEQARQIGMHPALVQSGDDLVKIMALAVNPA